MPAALETDKKCGKKKGGKRCSRREKEKKGDNPRDGNVTRNLLADDKGKEFRAGKVGSILAPIWASDSKPPSDPLLVHRAGTDVTFRCKAKGNPKPKITWNKDGKEIKTRRPGTDEKYKKEKWTLQVSKVTLGDTGNYTCHAENSAGRIYMTYYLRVLEIQPISEINIVERPRNHTAHVGDSVVFICRSDTWPAPKVTWTRDIKDIPQMQILGNLSPNTSLVEQETLRLHNVSKSDAGRYTCTMGNGMAHLQLSATLTVIDRDESLPFEPRCGIHFRQQILVDNTFGCQTPEPVEINYCMGSCGRSYYIPTVVTADDPNMQANHLNHTCQCCVGIVDQLRIVKLKCPEGRTRRGLITLYKECVCHRCSAVDVPQEKSLSEEDNVVQSDEEGHE